MRVVQERAEASYGVAAPVVAVCLGRMEPHASALNRSPGDQRGGLALPGRDSDQTLELMRC